MSLALLWIHKRMPRGTGNAVEPRKQLSQRGRGGAAFGLFAVLLGTFGLFVGLFALAVGPSGGVFQVLGLFWPGALALIGIGILSIMFG